MSTFTLIKFPLKYNYSNGKGTGNALKEPSNLRCNFPLGKDFNKLITLLPIPKKSPK